MKFCCEHTQRAHELVKMACEQISGQSSSETDEGKQSLRMFLPYASNYDMSYLNTAVKDYKRWMSKALAYLQKAEGEMESCKCSEEKKKLSPSETELEKENALFAQKNASLEDKVKEKEKYIKREEEEQDEAQNSIDVIEKNIEVKLLDNEADLEVIQAIFKSCEDVAKSQVELQALIEVPPRN